MVKVDNIFQGSGLSFLFKVILVLGLSLNLFATITNTTPTQTLSYPGKYPGMFSNGYAFAALKDDGSVVTWGSRFLGGDSSSVSYAIQSGVKSISKSYGGLTGGSNDNTQAIELNSGLIAHYEFEGNANDSSGNGNDGTEHGGVEYVDGVIGKAAKFDGVDDYIIKSNPVFSGSKVAISAWIKLAKDIGSEQAHIVCRQETGRGTEADRFPGVTGKDVANYFAMNGIDATDLGGSAPTIQVKAPE